MYLAGQMPERTVLILTGAGLHAIRQRGVASHGSWLPRWWSWRTSTWSPWNRDEHSSSALLFELLNEMDGMQEDLDVIFVLTTNARGPAGAGAGGQAGPG